MDILNSDKYLLAELMGYEKTKPEIDGAFAFDDGYNGPSHSDEWNPMEDEAVVEAVLLKVLETLRSKK